MHKKVFLALALSLSLSCLFAGGCAWLPGAKDRAEKASYSQARELEVMKVPEHLATPDYEDLFPVPGGKDPVNKPKTKGTLELKPPRPMATLSDDQNEPEKSQSVSLLAQSTSVKPAIKPSAKPSVQIKEQGGSAVLLMEQDFNYAWGALSDALKEAEFPVSDVDRSQARFYLRLKADGNESRLFKQLERKQLLKDNAQNDILILQIKPQVNAVMVFVENKQEQAVDYGIAEFVLRLLKEHLD